MSIISIIKQTVKGKHKTFHLYLMDVGNVAQYKKKIFLNWYDYFFLGFVLVQLFPILINPRLVTYKLCSYWFGPRFNSKYHLKKEADVCCTAQPKPKFEHGRQGPQLL